MINKASLVRLESGADDGKAVERFLSTARPCTPSRFKRVAWFAVRFGRGEHGIFQAFDDAVAVDGEVADASGAAPDSPPGAPFGPSDALWAQPPAVRTMDVLACKLPPDGELAVEKGLLLTFRAKEGHESQVAQFLRDARALVADEPGTPAWFAVQLDHDHFGIFDVFPDNGARFAHLTGHVPRELTKHAFSLLGGMPDMSLLDVVSAKISVET